MYKVTDYIRRWFAGMGDGLTGESLEARDHCRKILVSPAIALLLGLLRITKEQCSSAVTVRYWQTDK